MRLLATASEKLRLEDFQSGPPPYAILSHRWRDDEVTFEDIAKPDVTSMKGYAKVANACKMAAALGFKYLWMDTCCILKSSSAELTESINSMYKWYKEAGLCLAYLDDVEDDSQIRNSTWFRRGWTLQELIAPTEVVFFNRGWNMCGTKTSLASVIEDRTGIDEQVLMTGTMDGISIAKKMSWASRRETTRPEDEAYCLLGIFDINMPVIYGEGRRAFIRLQEEIVKSSDDQSIFAWGSFQPLGKYCARDDGHLERHGGLLAPSPSDFEECSDIVAMPFSDLEQHLGAESLQDETEITNLGIRLKLAVQLVDEERQVYLAYLAAEDTGRNGIVAIELQRLSGLHFARILIYFTSNLLHIPYSAVPDQGEVEAWDYLYVARKERRPWEGACVLAVVRIDSLLAFCEKHGYALAGFGELDGEDYAETSGPTAFITASNPGLETCILLRNEAKKLGILICLIIEPSRHNRAEKNFFSVRACTFGDMDGALPYFESSSEETVHKIIKTWKEAGSFAEPISPFTYLDLQDGLRLLLVTICDVEVAWENLDGENPCEYTLWAGDSRA